MLTFRPRKTNVRVALQSLEPIIQAKVLQLFEEVGREMVAWLESLTETERRWISRSGELAKGYRYKVQATHRGAKLTLQNIVPYSVILELRDGRFVLTGVTDPGGPLEQKLTEIGAKYGIRIARGR